MLALPLTAVLVLDGDANEVGLLRLMQLLPYLLFALLFGAIADRRARRPLMIGSNAVRAVLIGLVPALAMLDQLNLVILYVITFGVGLGAVMFDVCWMAYVPTIVSNREHLIEANGKLGATSSTADIAGPGLAGTLVHWLTAPVALAANACSYLVSIVSLMLIRTKEEIPASTQESRRHLLREAAEGLRWVAGNPILRVLAVLGASYNFFLTFIETVLLIYAVRTLSLGADGIGIILSAGAVGGLVGAMTANSVIRRVGIGKVYVGSVFVAFTAWILIPAASGPTPLVNGMLIAALFFTSVGIGMANVIVISLRQTVTPDRLMGRMTAAMRMLMFGVAAIGGPAGGFLASVVGLREALWIGAIASAIAVLPLFGSSIVRMRTLPEPPVPSDEPDADEIGQPSR
jgi:MFS family permease